MQELPFPTEPLGAQRPPKPKAWDQPAHNRPHLPPPPTPFPGSFCRFCSTAPNSHTVGGFTVSPKQPSLCHPSIPRSIRAPRCPSEAAVPPRLTPTDPQRLSSPRRGDSRERGRPPLRHLHGPIRPTATPTGSSGAAGPPPHCSPLQQPTPHGQLPVPVAVPRFSAPLTWVVLSFCFLAVTSAASCDLLFHLPTLRSQLSVFSFLLWG